MIRAHWEKTSTDGFSVRLHGWAFTDVEGDLKVTVVDGEHEERPIMLETFERSDVAVMFPDAPAGCGVVLTLGLEQFEALQPTALAWRVMDSRGNEQRVRPQANDAVWRALCFSDYESFAKSIQNPAFRNKDPNVQILGSFVARQRPNADSILRTAALVVILYRFITGDSKDERVGRYCRQHAMREYEAFSYSHGLEYRWKVSLGMAVGYFKLLDGCRSDAVDIFADIAATHSHLPLWPAMATNVVTAALLASFLQQGSADSNLLGEVPNIVRMTVQNAPLNNFYQYEEHVNLIKVASQCAVQHAAQGKLADWIGPTVLNVDLLAHIPRPVREVLKGVESIRS